MLMTSALNRKAANSKDVRVRVLGSTKKFTKVLPCSAGTFFTSRVPTCLKASAVSRTSMISSGERSLRPSRSFLIQRVVIALLPHQPYAFRFVVAGESDPHLVVRRGWDVFTDIVRADRKFPMTAVD